MVIICADEISKIIIQVGDSITHIYDLDEVMADELMKFEEGTISIL